MHSEQSSVRHSYRDEHAVVQHSSHNLDVVFTHTAAATEGATVSLKKWFESLKMFSVWTFRQQCMAL